MRGCCCSCLGHTGRPVSTVNFCCLQAPLKTFPEKGSSPDAGRGNMTMACLEGHQQLCLLSRCPDLALITAVQTFLLQGCKSAGS